MSWHPCLILNRKGKDLVFLPLSIMLAVSVGTFQTALLVLGPRRREYVDEPFNSRISLSYSHIVFLDVKPIVFQSQPSWGFVSLVQFPGMRYLMWGTNSVLFREEVCICEIHLKCGLLQWEWDLGKTKTLMSYSSWCGPFNLCCGKVVLLVIRSFSGGFNSYVAIGVFFL